MGKKRHNNKSRSRGGSSSHPSQANRPPGVAPISLLQLSPRPQGPTPAPPNVTVESVLAEEKKSTPALANDTMEISGETSTHPPMLLRYRDSHSESYFPGYERFYGLYDRYLLTYESREFVIDEIDRSQKAVLLCKSYDFRLDEWLKLKSDKHSLWDCQYDTWNSPESRKLNKVDKIQYWDCRRLAEDTRLVVQSMLKAVMLLHESGKYHGFLYHVENFVFRKEIEQRGGIQTAVLDCFLVYQNISGADEEDGKSIEKDMMRLSGMIFDVILGGKKLTCELDHLQNLMGDFRNIKVNRRLIGDHPSLWFWGRRFTFYELLWMKIHPHNIQTVQKVDRVFNLFEKNPSLGIVADRRNKLSHYIRSMLTSLGGAKNWHANLSKGTLLTRIQDGRFLNEDNITILNFLRVTHFHYLDKRHSKFQTDDETSLEEYYVLQSDGLDYLEDQFIEVLTSQTFPLFLVRVYGGLCGLGISV